MGEFQGQYVEDIKLACTASAVSGVNLVTIGKPGCGKTVIDMAVAKEIYNDRWAITSFESSSEPKDVNGIINIAKLLSADPIEEYIVKGTPYDPSVRCFIADDLGFANDAVWDAFRKSMTRVDIHPDDMAVIWVTANFMPTSERTRPMVDRFGLWHWVPDEPIDVEATVLAQMRSIHTGLSVGNGLPSEADIIQIRSMTAGPKAERAVVDVIKQLASEAQKGLTDDAGNIVASFEINRRRLDQWQRILSRMGFWLTKDDDFDTVPEDAKKCLKWAWPLLDETTANQWAAVCTSIADPVDGAIQSLLQACYKKFQEVNKIDNKQVASLQLGAVMQEGMTNIVALGISDPRIDNAMTDLKLVYSKYLRGENPFE